MKGALSFTLVFLLLFFRTATAVLPGEQHQATAPHADTSRVATAPEGHHGNENVGEIIVHHIKNDSLLVLPFAGAVHLPRFELFGVDLSITKHVVMMLTAAVLLVVVLSLVARRRRPDEVPTGFAAAIETVVEFIRNQIAIPNMGEKLGLAFTSYLCTVFFFILTCNLLGLIPYGATATGNVNVTAGLAASTFILTQVLAIKVNGIGGYFRHLTGGVHPAMWIVMIPVEFLGLFTKPFALCIRLYANMTAGHIVLLSLISLIFIMSKNGASPIVGIAIAPISVAFSLFVNVLELFVALLQAYIFTLLSSLFIGLAAAHHEETHEARH